MILRIVHPGVEYNVFSVRVRAFVPLSAPFGVRVSRLLELSGTPKLHSLVFSVFLPCGVRV